MTLTRAFEASFNKLYGKPCWGVWKGYGSSLVFNFGKPHLEIREPIVADAKASKRVRELLARRGAHVKGDWRLWIYCCDWEIFRQGKRFAKSSSSDERIERAAGLMDGEKLVRFTLVPRGLHCTFEFDLGSILVTKPFSRTHEQWMLYEPTGKVLTLRADKRYSHHPSDRADNQKDWKPIQR
jgi:hypothetical protein